jgi:hypothetical protein
VAKQQIGESNLQWGHFLKSLAPGGLLNSCVACCRTGADPDKFSLLCCEQRQVAAERTLMAIPKVDALELTLATSSLTRPSQTESYQEITVVLRTAGANETGKFSDFPEIVLWASGEKRLS